MTYTRPRSGIYAVVDDIEYLCDDFPHDGQVVLVARGDSNPNPGLFRRDSAGNWIATVSRDRCQRLADVTTRAQYQGRQCQVIDIAANGDVGLYFLGDDKSEAADLGFVQVDSGTWAKTVNIYELYTLYEHHADLLYGRSHRQPQGE